MINKYLLSILTFIIIYFFFEYLFDFILPFFLAYVLASFFYHKQQSKIISMFYLTLFYLFLIIILLLIIIISIDHLNHATSLIEIVTTIYQQYQDMIVQYIPNIFTSSMISIPKFSMNILLVIFGSYLFLWEYELMNQYLMKFKMIDHMHHLADYIICYFKGMFQLSCITFLCLLFAFYFIKVPYPFFLAFMTSFFDLLPLIGIGAILFPMSFLYYVIGAKTQSIALLVTYLFINLFRNIIEPHIYAKNFKVPMFIMFLLSTIIFQKYQLKSIFIIPIVLYYLKYLINS